MLRSEPALSCQGVCYFLLSCVFLLLFVITKEQWLDSRRIQIYIVLASLAGSAWLLFSIAYCHSRKFRHLTPNDKLIRTLPVLFLIAATCVSICLLIYFVLLFSTQINKPSVSFVVSYNGNSNIPGSFDAVMSQDLPDLCDGIARLDFFDDSSDSFSFSKGKISGISNQNKPITYPCKWISCGRFFRLTIPCDDLVIPVQSIYNTDIPLPPLQSTTSSSIEWPITFYVTISFILLMNVVAVFVIIHTSKNTNVIVT
jgi:hypothetical protein